MVAFEELQELWQSQALASSAFPPAPAEADAARVAELTQAFRRYGRRQNYFNVVRLAAVIWQIVLWAQVKEPRAPIAVCGIAVLLLGEFVFLFADWRSQLGIARLNFTEPSQEFVRNTIERLYEQRNPVRQYGWYLGVALAVGLNLLVLAAVAKNPRLAPLERIAYHLSACAAPLALFAVGLTIRGIRWNYECRPLVERLRAMERALEE